MKSILAPFIELVSSYRQKADTSGIRLEQILFSTDKFSKVEDAVVAEDVKLINGQLDGIMEENKVNVVVNDIDTLFNETAIPLSTVSASSTELPSNTDSSNVQGGMPEELSNSDNTSLGMVHTYNTGTGQTEFLDPHAADNKVTESVEEHPTDEDLMSIDLSEDMDAEMDSAPDNMEDYLGESLTDEELNAMFIEPSDVAESINEAFEELQAEVEVTEEGVIAKTLGSAALGGAAGAAFGGAYGGPVGAAVGGVAGAISGAKLGYKIGVATALDKAEKEREEKEAQEKKEKAKKQQVEESIEQLFAETALASEFDSMFADFNLEENVTACDKCHKTECDCDVEEEVKSEETSSCCEKCKKEKCECDEEVEPATESVDIDALFEDIIKNV